MDILESFTLAFRNLRQRRLRSFLTLIGIFAGIAAVVALISLGQGLENAVNDQFNSLGTNKFNVQGAGGGYGPPGTGAIGKVDEDDVRILERINGVTLAVGRYFSPATLEFQGIRDSVFVSSIPLERDRADLAMSLYNYEPSEGRLITFRDRGKVFIGDNLAEMGDDRRIEAGQKVIIANKTFLVIGIAKPKGNPIFDTSIIMSEDDMQKIGLVGDSYSLIGAEVDPRYDVLEVAEIAERTLRRDRGLKEGEEDFVISTPQQTLDSLNSILTTIQILLVGIASISLLVGAIGIANTMYTAVLERNREIGIMKAIGGKRNDILSIFLIESGLLGLAGGILGLIIGILIAKGVEFIAFIAFGDTIIQASFSTMLILGSLAFAFALGTLSGYLPARQAAGLDPVLALQK